jgi:hypothetical protein
MEFDIKVTTFKVAFFDAIFLEAKKSYFRTK